MIRRELFELYEQAYQYRCTDGESFTERINTLTDETFGITPYNIIVLNQTILNDLKNVISIVNKRIEMLEAIIIYSYNTLNNLESIECEEWVKDTIYKDTFSVIELSQHLIDIENGMNDL